VEGLVAYIESNAQYFNQAMAQIPGVKAMPMEGTYLAWIDFEGCGMSREEIHDRIYRQAKIAATPGHTLGAGGENYMRFNLGTQRAVIEDAVARLQDVFSDLQ
jgi:cystathionine beta-lyase